VADEWTEDEYVAYLHGERRCFAWVMQRYGDRTPAQAEVAAQECYPYEASDVPFRGLIFHDHSWHWAMLAIHGGSYWVEHPELLDPPPEYWALDDPDTIWLTQLWVDKEAHDATTRSEPVAAVSRRVPPLLARQPEGFYGHAVHVHGRTAES
jgi:hypothetical protein